MGALPVCAGRTLVGVYQGFKSIFGGSDEITSLPLERPPQLQLETQNEDTIIQDWRWLALKCERRLISQSNRKGPTRHVAETLGAKFQIDQFACFVPRTVLEAIADCRIRYSDDFDIIIEQFNGAVVFCDASGFTALTEALDKEPDGAEKLGECINAFFGPLIQIVNYWGGDIIKFSGDALTIVWPVDDDPVDEYENNDLENEEQPGSEGPYAGHHHIHEENKFSDGHKYHEQFTAGLKKISRQRTRATSSRLGTGDFSDTGGVDRHSSMPHRRERHYRIDKRQACRLACQCCLDLHFNLNFFPTPAEGKFFTLHIGVGYGRVTVLQVGGTLDRWEYVVAGPPLQQISVAEPLASSGETVVSPAVIEALGGEEGAEFSLILKEGVEGYAKLLELRGQEVIPPPPLENIVLDDTDVDLLKRFIPPAVFKRLTAGHNVFINELRRVSVVFVAVHGLDVSTERGSHAAHKLMQLTQKAAYTMEGSVNKFLVDDKGVLILIMFGLPPVYHLDDALRAVMAALRIVDGLRMLGLTAGIGVATGRVWCGTVGCWLRKEYTAMGDTVNVAARLMGKAQTNEINCDLETKSLCDHVMEFRALPPVKTKGKQHLVPVFQPTGRMKRQAVLQTTTGEPISTWPAWKYKNRVSKLFLPGYEYRKPILGLDRPPFDFPLSCGALFPWEYIEPWLPSLRPTIYLGGVAVIVGKETDGTTELVQRVAELAQQLGRSHFLCSNMPDSTYVNIANVPLLAWRKLCTEMVETWRWSPARERKGFSKVDRDNSMYGLSKELIHPIFHWRLHEMKPVIHGLVLPYEVPQNQVAGREQLRGTGKKGNRKKIDRLLRKASNFVASLKGEELSDEGLGVRHSLSEEAENGFMGFQASSPHMSPQLPGMTEEEQSLAPVICSLVNGFSMFEPCIVCLHVRSGTSLFASMDSESWKVARLVGRIAMMRRRRKIELDTKELKRWRRQHSRDCIWCRGTAQPYKGLKGEIYHPKWTTWCKPPESRYFPPFLFVLVCSDTTSHISEQQELVQWGRECNCLIEMKRMSPVETGSYLGHCLSVPRKNVPDDLIEYVCRISAGIPKYIYLTARQLIVEQAIVVDTASKDLEDEWDRYRDSEGRHPFDSFVREADPNSSTKVSLNNEDNKAGSKDSASFSKGASQGSKKFSRLRHHWSHGSFTSHAVATSQRTRRLAVGSRTPENPAAVLKSNHMGAGEGELVSSAGVQPALSVAEPDTRDEERRILHESFFSHALTGKTNIPEDATTSDADSECSTERFKTNSASQVLDNTPPLLSATAITPARPRCKQRKKVITVYSFDHHMELLPDAAARTAPSGTGLPDLDISVSSRMRKKRKSRLSLAGTFLSSGVASPAPTPRSASHQRLRSLGSQGSGTRSTRDSLLGFSGLLRKDDGSNTSRRGSLKQKVDVQPSTDILSIDELRVSQVHCVDPSVDLNCLGDYYVVKTAGPQSLQSPAVYVKQAEALQAEREAQRLEAFHGAFGEAIQNAESLAQKKYEEPLMHTFGENLVRSVASEEPANTIDKRKPVEETCSLGSLAPTDTRTSLKGVDFYHPGVPAPFVPPGPDVFASRLAQHAFAPALETSCQTRYEREKENQQRESVKSTAEEAAEEIRAKEKLQRNRCVYVIKDLKKVPFVSELLHRLYEWVIKGNVKIEQNVYMVIP